MRRHLPATQQELRTVAAEIHAMLQVLRQPGPHASPTWLAAAAESCARWRRAVSALEEGQPRDRLIWALLGAERHLHPRRGGIAKEANLAAVRLRMEAAARAVDALEPGVGEIPLPTP